MPRWLLPENISDVLPQEARRVESLRRALLDLYGGYGYELVIPPLIEFVDSLTTGTGSDLDLRIFKLVDQASGRMLGLRADTTPQVARIDAHILNRSGVVRLAYAGSVLHARPLHPQASREPLQIGAELYGSSALEADAEVLELALASLRLAGMTSVHLDMGHTGVVRGLLSLAPMPPQQRDELLGALNAKDLPALEDCVRGLDRQAREGFLALARCVGGIEMIDAARSALPRIPAIAAALDELAVLARSCEADQVSIDLADLHAYHYLTGVSFAVHAAGLPSAVLRGGRYDEVGRAFGRARPAVGFSVYLRELAGLGTQSAARAILAPALSLPAPGGAELRTAVRSLRERGEVVIQSLPGDHPPGDDDPADGVDGLLIDRVLVRSDGGWRVEPRSGPVSSSDS